MIKQVYIVLFGLILFQGTASAQKAAKSVYAELGGPALASLNFDMRFNKAEGGLGFKVGVGGFRIGDESALLIPLALNNLIGRDQKNYFEVGGGITIVSIKERTYDFYGNTQPGTSRFSTTFGHAYFGYRLQPKDGGFLFRAGICPLFNRYGFFPYWAGISFGYKF